MAELVIKGDLDTRLTGPVDRVNARIDNLDSKFEAIGLCLIIRLGTILAVGIAPFATL